MASNFNHSQAQKASYSRKVFKFLPLLMLFLVYGPFTVEAYTCDEKMMKDCTCLCPAGVSSKCAPYAGRVYCTCDRAQGQKKPPVEIPGYSCQEVDPSIDDAGNSLFGDCGRAKKASPGRDLTQCVGPVDKFCVEFKGTFQAKDPQDRSQCLPPTTTTTEEPTTTSTTTTEESTTTTTTTEEPTTEAADSGSVTLFTIIIQIGRFIIKIVKQVVIVIKGLIVQVVVVVKQILFSVTDILDELVKGLSL